MIGRAQALEWTEAAWEAISDLFIILTQDHESIASTTYRDMRRFVVLCQSLYAFMHVCRDLIRFSTFLLAIARFVGTCHSKARFAYVSTSILCYFALFDDFVDYIRI